jgi:hypothetical protein
MSHLPCFLFFFLSILVITFVSFPDFVISLNYRRYLATCLTLKEGFIRKLLTRWFYNLFLSLLFGIVFLILLFEFLINFDKTLLVFAVFQTLLVFFLYKPVKGFVVEQAPLEVSYRIVSLLLPFVAGFITTTIYTLYKYQTLEVSDVIPSLQSGEYLKHLWEESLNFACPLLGKIYFFLKVLDYSFWSLTLLSVKYPLLYTLLVLYLILKSGAILWATAKVITDYRIIIDLKREG